MSSINEIHFTNAKQELTVVFTYDLETVYTYKGVSKAVAHGLKNAESRGTYFHANIRGKYEFTKEAK